MPRLFPKGKLNKNSPEPINLFEGVNLITWMPVKPQGKVISKSVIL